MNPYNNDPFKTDTHEVTNETDANRALCNTLRGIARAANLQHDIDTGADITDGLKDWEK